MASKTDRLAEFFKRLASAPSAKNASEARALIERILNAVEDEFTSVPFDPPHWRSDGRLYPPQNDNMIAIDSPSAICFRSFRHLTYIGVNGAIELREKSGIVVLSKPGSDGKTLSQVLRGET